MKPFHAKLGQTRGWNALSGTEGLPPYFKVGSSSILEWGADLRNLLK